MKLVVLLLLGMTPGLLGQDALLNRVHVAQPYGTDRVLIVGNPLDPKISEKLVQYPMIQKAKIGEWLNAVPPDALDRGARLHPGDRWQLFPGSGPGVTIVVEQTVVIGHGCAEAYAGAIARFATGSPVPRFNYALVGQEGALSGVSSAPLVPVAHAAVQDVLKKQARLEMKKDDWRFDGAEAAELDKKFLDAATTSKLTVKRWAPAGRKPLLFVQALWMNRGAPTFAATAVLEEPGRVVHFDAKEAHLMRMYEFESDSWDFELLTKFENAWKIGNRYFVLTTTSGLESWAILLNELKADGSFHEVAVFYGSGC